MVAWLTEANVSILDERRSSTATSFTTAKTLHDAYGAWISSARAGVSRGEHIDDDGRAGCSKVTAFTEEENKEE